LSASGVQVMLVDDGPIDGGALVSLGLPERDVLIGRHPLGDAVVHRQSTAAGVFGADVLVITSEGTMLVRASALVLACGAHDTGVPIAGNDLPGVMSARAVGRLAACGIAIAEQVAVVGDGPFGDAIERLLEGQATIRRVAFEQVRSLEGRDRVRAVRLDDGTKHEVGAVAVEGARAPAHELVVQAGGQVELGPNGFVPVSDPSGRVAPGVWCTGECAGLPFDPDRIEQHAAAVAGSVRVNLR